MDDSIQTKESDDPSNEPGNVKRKASGASSDGLDAKQPASKTPRLSEVSTGDQQSRKVERPKKPLSAYNLFFSNERKSIMQSGESLSDVYEREVKPDTTVQAPLDNFQCLVKIVSKRWKNITKKDRDKYEAMARKESRIYDDKMEDYLKYEEELKETDRRTEDKKAASKREAVSRSTSVASRDEEDARATFGDETTSKDLLPDALVAYLQAASWEKLVQILAFVMVLESSNPTPPSNVAAQVNTAPSNPMEQIRQLFASPPPTPQAPGVLRTNEDIVQPLLQAFASAIQPSTNQPSGSQVSRTTPSDSLQSLLHPRPQAPPQSPFDNAQQRNATRDSIQQISSDSIQQISSLLASALTANARPTEVPPVSVTQEQNHSGISNNSIQQISELFGALASSQQSQAQAQVSQANPMDALNALMNQMQKSSQQQQPRR